MTSKTLEFNFYLKQWPTNGKRWDEGNTQTWISCEQKKFLDEIKDVFLNF